MLTDACRDPPRTTVRCDVCIVGAGPAGMTLARELDDGQREICLLESGGESSEVAAQSLLAAARGSDDYPPLQATRVAALGGSTHVLAGWCRPLDAIDFECRPECRRAAGPSREPDWIPFMRKPTRRSGSDRSSTIPSRGSARPAAAHYR